MIAEHGDVVLLKYVNKANDAVVSTITLSNAKIKCTADMKDVQKIVKTKQPRIVYV